MDIRLHAIPEGRFARRLADLLPSGLSPQAPVATLVADTTSKAVSLTLNPSIPLDDVTLAVHGFAPRGWRTDPIASLPLTKASATGVWNYTEAQEENILAGLSYLLVRSRKDGTLVLRAQIEQVERPEAKLEDHVTLTGLAGRCQSRISIDGILNDVPMDMAPAQVLLARTGASRNKEGRLEQTIGCAVRVGDARVPGVGRVEIQMFGDENPGSVESMSAESDFPARMTLDVHKRYLTAFGTYYTDTEQFVAENIERFPPFGVRFKPMIERAPLKSEQTQQVVGHITLGWLVPLFHLDRSDFPSKLPLVLEEGEEE
jgi:hypothetical protein